MALPHRVTLDAWQQQRADDRRAQLAHYRAAYAERYGRQLAPQRHEKADPVLAAILEGRDRG